MILRRILDPSLKFAVFDQTLIVIKLLHEEIAEYLPQLVAARQLDRLGMDIEGRLSAVKDNPVYMLVSHKLS